ncbi:RGS domain-containing protein [Syncephalastrum racemosum]|uniref:RGS domain-containing protein n=1 Tax=Syncephalastrum racemosum TaxID=13706 RepID=A0A1X2H4Z7_SYNRA|nr:RGS domain-containing protein [Syncephalastrum racemosum]
MACARTSPPLTLEAVLGYKSRWFDDFARYLQQSFCAENLAFWLAVQRYRHTDEDECMAIVMNHIQPNSPQEINIPCEMRQDILSQVRQGAYQPAIFAAAADSVLELMRANSFIPWSQQLNDDPHDYYKATTAASLPASYSFPENLSDMRKTSFLGRVKRSLAKKPSNYALQHYASAPNSPRSSEDDSLRWTPPWRKKSPHSS